MQISRLKIDFNQGLLEVDGSENLILEVYKDFKEALALKNQRTILNLLNENSDNSQIEVKEISKDEMGGETNIKTKKTIDSKKKSPVKAKKSTEISGQLVKDLNLMQEGEKISLRDFHKRYIATTNFERSLIFAYYLQHVKEIENININHIFTCYRHIPDVKVPNNLKQNLFDIAYRKGWLDTSNIESIKVSISGMNHLEHDLLLAEQN
ncbi:TPA: hypothetical protein MW252_001428 [Acinetobacter nosocomialis]|nr:hypothetical protein [Acinetobacter nosocomialis]